MSPSFKLLFTKEAKRQIGELERSPDQLKRFRAVRKALGLLETNPRYPSLRTHKYQTLTRELGVEVFEAYAEQNTPAAYRIFWHYGPDRGQITILTITPHP